MRLSWGNLELMGMLRIFLTSWGRNNCLTTSSFQLRLASSMSKLTFASGGIEGRGEVIELQTWSGSHLSSLIHTVLPSPIHHTTPFTPRFGHLEYSSMHKTHLSSLELQGWNNLEKNQALKTLWHNDSRFFNICHTCLASKASLNFSISLKPKPPKSLPWHRRSHFTQCTFLLSPLYPHQNFRIIISISFIKPLGSLKQLIE